MERARILAVAADIPVPPGPDGTARIQGPREKEMKRDKKLLLATVRSNDFIVHGTVPDDLRRN